MNAAVPDTAPVAATNPVRTAGNTTGVPGSTFTVTVFDPDVTPLLAVTVNVSAVLTPAC